MLLRFTKIKNVGRFADVTPGGRAFAERTIVFGKNGNGKSTLTAVLRSLATNEPKLIKERKTFGTTADQEVELVMDLAGQNAPVRYQHEAWSQQVKDVVIFDTKFIAQNIFDGEKPLDTQRTNLHRVIVGEQGKELADDMVRLGVGIRTRDAEITQKNREYARLPFASRLVIDQFIAMSEAPDIDKDIKELEKEKEFASLASRPDIPSASTRTFDPLQEAFAQTGAAAHSQAKEMIEKHITAHWDNPAHRREFLSEGLQVTKGYDCPFCGQDLGPVGELIDAYRSFFDENYRAWERSVKEQVDRFLSWNLDAELGELALRLAEWSKYVEECATFLAKLNSERPGLLEAKRKFDEECLKKLRNLEYEPDFDALETVKRGLAGLNMGVEAINRAIATYRARIGAKDMRQIDQELLEAQATKERYTAPWKTFCDEYAHAKTERERLNQERDAKGVALAAYSKQAFADHQTKINEVLASLDADFRVNDLEERQDRRKGSSIFCGFDLIFFGKHPVVADSEEGPRFDNTLSQGGKNMLAFAFFMANVWNDSELRNKIIVFDDPISSFDHERKYATADLLGNLANSLGDKPKQLLVFTHDRSFLVGVAKHPQFSSAKYLKLIPAGTTMSGCECSDLDDCDAEKEFMQPLEAKYLEEIEELTTGNVAIPPDAHDKCRAVLERVFRTKYQLPLKDVPRNKSLGGYVDKLVDLKIYDENRAKEFRNIIPKLHEPNHTGSSKDDSEGDVKYVLRETLRLIHKV